MRRPAATASIEAMATEPPSLCLSLVLEVDGEPIAGRLLGLQGDERCFRGWLDLASALQRLLEQARASAPGDSARLQDGAA